MKMSDFLPDFDKKHIRRKNLQNKSRDKKYYEDSESQKFSSKYFKQRKKQIEEEELWDDWESDLYDKK